MARWFFDIQGRFRYQYNNVIEGQNYYREGVSNQFSVGALITRRNIDNPIFPSAGSSLKLDVELSGGALLPYDYLKIGFTAEWYRRLFNSNRIALYTIADFGYGIRLYPKVSAFWILLYGRGNGLVIATTPLRGYDDRTVGPKNPSTGQVIGGRVMAKFGAELRVAVTLEPIPLYILAFRSR